MNKISSLVVGAMPPAVGRFLGDQGRQGGPQTALRMSELIALRHTAVRSLWMEADAIVAVCAWVKDLLEGNGIAAHKITVSHHGLVQRHLWARRRGANAKTRQSLKLVFLGRLDPTKGVDLLVRALRALPRAAIELDVYGISQGGEDDQYLGLLLDLASEDRRVSFLEPIPAEQVARTLLSYDVLAVPSQGMETGPLVVLDAFDAGVPVLGSALGGIAELVQHGVNGLLVQPYDEIHAWTAALQTFVAEPGLLGRLAAGVAPPRGMDDVSREMLVIYKRAVTSTSPTCF